MSQYSPNWKEDLLKAAIRAKRDEKWNEARRDLSRKDFKIGDKVIWGGSKKCPPRRGIIAEIIPKGKYPQKWSGLRVQGFYREITSYVVESEGSFFWPHTAWLEKEK